MQVKPDTLLHPCTHCTRIFYSVSAPRLALPGDRHSHGITKLSHRQYKGGITYLTSMGMVVGVCISYHPCHLRKLCCEQIFHFYVFVYVARLAVLSGRTWFFFIESSSDKRDMKISLSVSTRNRCVTVVFFRKRSGEPN